MIEKFKCNSCQTIITSEKIPNRCSCGSTNIEEFYLDKKALLGLLKNDFEEEENPLHKEFLVEDREEEQEIKKLLLRVFEDIQFIINKYLDIEEKHTKIIALWIIGSWFHKDFNSYPYLYLNAMRGSGKTRLLNLIAGMSWEGSVQNSMTDAVLFRTQGTLCIDEAEGFGKKGKETLLELLNSGYKKGTKVRRMKKKKTNDGEDHVVEEFELYRPISIANITGIDNVLGDRCIKIVIEKSVNMKKTRLIENLLESKIGHIRALLASICRIQCSLCNVVTPENLYKEWNNYILDEFYSLNYISSLTTLTTLTTLKEHFDLIKETTINGRDLELSFPLLIIAMWIDGAYEINGTFQDTLKILDDISNEKKQDESIENLDISFYSFISQGLEVDYFVSIQKLTEGFRQFLQTSEDWINNRWVGRALSRLQLIIEKRRLTRGVEVKINYKKAKDKIRMFK